MAEEGSTNLTRHENGKKTHVSNMKKRENPARLPAKINIAFLQPAQNTAPATQNARVQIHWWPQVKMHMFHLEKQKKAFHLHKMQMLKETEDEFIFIRMYIYIYIYLYIDIYLYIYIYTCVG